MLILAALLLLQSPSTPAVHWRVVERAKVSWRAGSPSYELLMEAPDSSTGRDMGGRMLVRIDGKPLFVFTDTSGPKPFRTVGAALPEDLARRNGIASTHFYLVRTLSRTLGTPLLFAFPGQYEDHAGPTLILGLDSTGYPFVISSADISLETIVDLNGDGVAELVARTTVPQGFSRTEDCTVGTYDPLAVYHLSHGPHPTLQYDSTLSRRYNQAHYVWVGPAPRDQVAVKWCTGGKVSLVTPPD